MKIKITKKFEIMPGKFLFPTGNEITVLNDAGYRAVKSGCAISISQPEINPVKKEKKIITTKNSKKEDK